MNKLIKDPYTLHTIEEAVLAIGEDKYITVDSLAAYRAITETIIDKENLKLFVAEAKKIIPAIVFRPLDFNQIKEYCREAFIALKNAETNSSGDINIFDIYDLMNLFDRCEIYAQRYVYRFLNPKATLFILNTPTESDFKLAKESIINILELLEKGINTSGAFDSNDSIPNVQLRIRGTVKFIDIKIGGVYDSASVGIDFR